MTMAPHFLLASLQHHFSTLTKPQNQPTPRHVIHIPHEDHPPCGKEPTPSPKPVHSRHSIGEQITNTLTCKQTNNTQT